MSVTILTGDAETMLRTLPDQSVQCCVTSPPYFALRDYGTAQWDGGDSACDHIQAPHSSLRPERSRATSSTFHGSMTTDNSVSAGTPYRQECGKCGATRSDNQIGLESTLAEYLDRLVSVFREVRRVLANDGCLWLNIGDSYGGGNSGQTVRDSSGGVGGGSVRNSHDQPSSRANPGRAAAVGYKPKDLMMVPARLALALQADGWYLRSDIIWAKPNPMPESVTDRPTSAHEHIFLLSKSARYFYDADAIREPLTASSVSRLVQNVDDQHGSERANGGAKTNGTMKAVRTDKQRGHSRRHDGFNDRWDAMSKEDQQANGANARNVWTIATVGFPGAHFATFAPEIPRRCILAGSRPGDTILDCFAGAGTTGLVADRLDRNAILIELNPEYVQMARDRIYNDAPLFAEVTT